MGKKKIIGIFISVAVVFLVLFVLFELFIGSITIRGKKEYGNFNGFLGKSNLEIFPKEIDESAELLEYQYYCVDTFMQPTCKVYLECYYENQDAFETECERLAGISVTNEQEEQDIVYSTELFAYPAYVTNYDWFSSYEYALVLENEQKIVYVYLEGNLPTPKVSKEYMPLEKEGETSLSIYSFDGYFDSKYR